MERSTTSPPSSSVQNRVTSRAARRAPTVTALVSVNALPAALASVPPSTVTPPEPSCPSADNALARRWQTPVVIHSRGAFRECVERVDASGVDWRRVVFHCFVEGPDEMELLLERGGGASFTGVLTYKNAETVRAAARRLGWERFLLETDAPFLTPTPHRGKPNEPAYVALTAAYAAELFGIPLERLAEASTRNARQLFGF